MGIFFFAWIVLSFFVAIIGVDRKIGYWATFFASLFLSPIIGALFALASERKINTKELYKCPYCAEYIKYEAKICKHCGKSLQSNDKLNLNDFQKHRPLF